MTTSLEGHPIRDIRAILSNAWFDANGQPVELPFLYQSEVSDFTYDFDFGALGASGRTAFREVVEDAVAQVQSFADVTFSEGVSVNHFDFDYTPSRGGGGWASWNAWDRNADGDIDELFGTVEIGGEAFNPYIVYHELGHLLTLEHTGPSQSPDVAPFLEAAYRNNNFTVMHYTNDGNGQAFGEWDYRGYGLLDIYALQLRFGANMATYAGDDTHTATSLWTDETEGFLLTIWDAGGKDVLDFSDIARDQLIDIGEGRFSDVGEVAGASPDVVVGDPLDLDYTQPNYNLSIAYGAQIEDAVGGSGDDVVYGNALDNTLFGGAGDDILYGDGFEASTI